MTCVSRAEGFRSTGFIAASGSTLAAAAWAAWARPISAPSLVTKELSAMFCALKGATLTPSRKSQRQMPATTTLLPASEWVPATSKALSITRTLRLFQRFAPLMTRTFRHASYYRGGLLHGRLYACGVEVQLRCKLPSYTNRCEHALKTNSSAFKRRTTAHPLTEESKDHP